MIFTPLHQSVVSLVKKNRNAIVLITGETGTSKSYSGITLCHELSQVFGSSFSIKGNVAFNFPDLLKKMQLPENQKKGSCYLFDECGVSGSGGGSREWQSKSNRYFHSFLQTCRHRNQILIMTTPSFSFLEKGARHLCHFYLNSLKIDYNRRVAIIKPLRLQTNDRSGKTFFKYIRYRKGRNIVKFKRLEVPHPPMDLTKSYEKQKLKFTTELNQGIIDSENAKNKPRIPKSKVSRELVSTLLEQGWKYEKISNEIGCSVRTIARINKEIKNNDNN